MGNVTYKNAQATRRANFQIPVPKLRNKFVKVSRVSHLRAYSSEELEYGCDYTADDYANWQFATRDEVFAEGSKLEEPVGASRYEYDAGVACNGDFGSAQDVAEALGLTLVEPRDSAHALADNLVYDHDWLAPVVEALELTQDQCALYFFGVRYCDSAEYFKKELTSFIFVNSHEDIDQLTAAEIAESLLSLAAKDPYGDEPEAWTALYQRAGMGEDNNFQAEQSAFDIVEIAKEEYWEFEPAQTLAHAVENATSIDALIDGFQLNAEQEKIVRLNIR